MKFTIWDLYAFSIAIAAILGLVKFKRINPAFYPFLYVVWLAFANEVLGYFLIYAGHSNAVNINIYLLAESLLLVWQFRVWRTLQNRALFWSLIVSLVLFWIIESFVFDGLTRITTAFRAFEAIVIIILSTITFGRELPLSRSFRNPLLLICLTFIVYFTFSAIIGVFWLYGVGGTSEFRRATVLILIYINVFCNLIYALAVLWMPAKTSFTLPY